MTDTPSTTEAPATPPVQAPPGAQATSATILAGATKDELDDLDNWYDHGDLSARREQRNAQQAVALGKLSLTGYPPSARGFEQQMPSLQARIAALPQDKRDLYTGEATALKIAWDNTPDSKTRDTLERQFMQLGRAVASDYANVLADPVLHTESLFNLPYGYAHLSAEDQKSADQLEDYRDDYHTAQSTDEREAIVSEVAQLRAGLQNKIGDALLKSSEDYRQQLQGAQADLDRALQEATSMQGDKLNGGDRATQFGSTAFKDELHARAFTEDYLRRPAKYAALEQWESDLKQRDDDANASDRSRTTKPPVLPEFQRFTDIAKQPPLPNSQYGSNLLASYQSAQQRMVAGMNHISVQGDPGGPLYSAYVKKYSAPAPVWKQELDEIVCRVTTGMLPGVNMFTNVICPRSPLDDETRRIIDTTANAVGAALGVAFPEAGGGILTKLDPLESVGGALGSAVGKLLGKVKASGSAGLETLARELPTALANARRSDAPLAEAKARIEGPEPLPDGYAVKQPLTDTGKSGVTWLGQDANGNAFVNMKGQNFYVQWDAGVNSYRAYSGDNPFQPPIPVARNAKGEWEVAAAPAKLEGGAPPLTPQKRQEIGDYIAAHPDETFTSVANRFNVNRTTITSIARSRQLSRRAIALPDPATSATIVADLRSGKSFSEIARSNALPRRWIAEIARDKHVELPVQRGPVSLAAQKSIIDDIQRNPGATYKELAARHGVSNTTVSNIAARKGVRDQRYGPYYARVYADERQRIAQYAREHPDARASDLAHRFGRSQNAIRRVLATAGAPAPAAALGSADQQAIDQALRAQSGTSYASIAQTTHTQADAVRDYAELHALTRGELGPDDNAAALPADLAGPSAADVDNAIANFDPLTGEQKTEINKYGAAFDASFFAGELGKPVWMIENYMKSPDYLAAAGARAPSAANDDLIQELFGELTDADRNVIDEWKSDLTPEQLADNLGKPVKLVNDYLGFAKLPPGTSSTT